MSDPPASPPARGRIRILLVATEGGASELSSVLSQGGFEPPFTRVETEEDLARALDAEPFDIAICDDGLPVLGGPAVLRRIKSRSVKGRSPELPVIVVSSTFGESIAAAAMKAGANDFIAQGYLARLVPAVEREIQAAEVRRDGEAASRALRQAEELYRDLMEHSHVLVWAHDLSGRILTANVAAARNLGWDSGTELPRGFRMQDLLAPESLEHIDEYLAQLREEGIARGLMTVRTRTGEERYWEYRNTLRTESVETPSVRGIAFDVTDRVRAEQDLREARQFSEEIIAGAGEGIIVYGPDLRYVLWNPFMEELTGVPARDIIGRSPRETFPDVMEKHGVYRLLERALAGEKVTSSAIPFHVPATGRSGWVSTTYAPHRSHDGRIVGVIGIVEDVTERKAGEEKLRESREFMERAQEVGQIGSWTSGVGDDDTVVWSRETCRIFGMDPEGFEGTVESFFARVHPADRDSVKRAGRDAVAHDRPYRLEHRIVRPDGTVRWVYERGDVIRDEDGQARRIVGIVQDITERRLLEEQFLQSQKMEAIGRLAGGVAHDFNNLLTAILGYTDLLLAQVPSGDPMRGDLEEISRSGERAAALTRQLLAFSRRQMLEPKILDVNSVVTNLEKMLRRLIGEDILLEIRLDPEIDFVRADPGQLEQVLVNLAVNSRDAMPSGGTMRVETHPVDFGSALELGGYAIAPGRYVRIDFSDTGAGMVTATLARVFEPFFTTKEKGKGTGLGLATAYGIIKQSGGYIACESEVGKGTRFQIFLPRSLERPAGVEAEAAPSRQSLRGSETVLLVEDEEGVRRLSRKLLEAHGYQVLEASSGEAAIEVATRFPGEIHLLLTDIVMPGLDGTEAAARIRELRPQIRVLYMSGYSEGVPARLAMESALLQKPFTPQALAQRVREALAS